MLPTAKLQKISRVLYCNHGFCDQNDGCEKSGENFIEYRRASPSSRSFVIELIAAAKMYEKSTQKSARFNKTERKMCTFVSEIELLATIEKALAEFEFSEEFN